MISVDLLAALGQSEVACFVALEWYHSLGAHKETSSSNLRLQELVAASRLVTTQIQADLVGQIFLGTFRRQPLGFQPLLDLLDIRMLAAQISGTEHTHDIAESWRTRVHVTTVRYNQAKTSLDAFDLESCAVRSSSPHEPTVSYSYHPLASPR